MDLKTITPAEAKDAVTAMETVDQLRLAATELGIKYSGNTGEGTLRKNIMDFLDAMPEVAPASEDTPPEMAPLQSTQEPVPQQEAPTNDILGNNEPLPEIITQPKVKKAPGLAELAMMDVRDIDPSNQILIRQVVRAKALRVSRVRITNLDPSDSMLNGGIVTVMNKYTGKVSKYIPYGDESEGGYHVEEILLNHLRNQQFALRKEIKGGQFGVKKYKTTMVRKFAIEVLPDLTKKELSDLAATQRASQAIDN